MSVEIDQVAPTQGAVEARASRGREGALERGAELGRYLVLERLGAGGMGVVYSAWDPQLDRKLAVKILHAAPAPLRPPRPGDTELASGPSPSLDTNSARLMREAQALARIHHPNVVTIHDVGAVKGRVFVAMEFIDGQTLRAWLDEAARPWTAILDVFLEAGRGLAAAHAAGLVHRDFKPDNVMLCKSGRVCVLDFGLARADGEQPVRPEQAAAELSDRPSSSSDGALSFTSSVSSGSVLTRTGALLGTPAYMAPEQFQGGGLDPRSDQFSFCVALWEAITGARPFSASSPMALVYAALDGELRPFSPRPAVLDGAKALPEGLVHALRRGLAGEPEDRFEDMGALLDAIARARTAPRRLRRRRRLLAASAAVVFGLGALASVALDRPDPARSCRSDSRAVAEVWNPRRARAIDQAFATTQLSFASRSADKIRAPLDAWARDWTAMHDDACAAHYLRGEQSAQLFERRVACLDRQLSSFSSLVDALAEADAEVVEHAGAAVGGLPNVADCGDLRQLRAALSEPRAPHQRLRLHRARALLDRATQLARLDRLEAAKPLFTAVEAEARVLGYEPFVAEVALARARELWLPNGRDEAAVEALGEDATKALIAARRGQAEHLEITAMSLVALSAARRSDFDEATRWLDIADAIAEPLDDRGLALELLHTRARTENLAGNWAAAEPRFRAVVADVEAMHGRDSLEYAQAELELGLLLIGRQQAQDALPLVEHGLQVATEQLGDHHPTVAEAHAQLGLAHTELAQTEAALESFRRAQTLVVEVRGETDRLNLRMLAYQGIALSELGRCDESRAALERLRSLSEAEFQRESARWAHAARLSGWSCRWSHPESVALLEESAAIHERLGGRYSYAWVDSALNHGFALLVRERDAEARTCFDDAREALARVESVEAQDRWWNPNDMLAIGDALLRLRADVDDTDALAEVFALRERLDPHAMLGPYGLLEEATIGRFDPRGPG
ncbi:serine/threonine kinase family protein [Plesiocystis pacifica SIR-1]|uniref:Serine/threonine kinase family protein n=1 Tax=Plesiocystis pacifica SIR-1 TaxID=391625 RepID=A6FXQ0_9BACT|nr:serine/threonine-protein kinase [Plesiocystis pacifica]EDM81638.1 serine/threonine kinase family protein [Plesiocystis pacifica SIR-1]